MTSEERTIMEQVHKMHKLDHVIQKKYHNVLHVILKKKFAELRGQRTTKIGRIVGLCVLKFHDVYILFSVLAVVVVVVA